MRINQLPGWPPTCFKSAESPAREIKPKDFLALRLQSISFIPGYRKKSPGDLVLIMKCTMTEDVCTARLKVANSELGKRAMAALSTCKGLSFAQAGNRVIPGETG